MIKKIVFFDIVILITSSSIYITTLDEYTKYNNKKISYKKILNKQFKNKIHDIVKNECQNLNNEMSTLLNKLQDTLYITKYYQPVI